ncbi:MAG: methyltransferase domain-containing protein [Gemmatimonadota bacterium]|nr:methyltransferase domain-containing protein [Gemmatimonadota bacterium]
MGELEAALPLLPPGRLTLLDVGSGLGDIPARAREWAAGHGRPLTTIGVECSAALAAVSHSPNLSMVLGDARRLPFRSRSIDVVLCSQLLHHFEWDDAAAVMREMDRVARHRVIVSDLRRSWFGAAGIWLASFPLGFHPVSRHDGAVSVMRGFTRRELEQLTRSVTGSAPALRQRPLFRVSASWTPTG